MVVEFVAVEPTGEAAFSEPQPAASVTARAATPISASGLAVDCMEQSVDRTFGRSRRRHLWKLDDHALPRQLGLGLVGRGNRLGMRLEAFERVVRVLRLVMEEE